MARGSDQANAASTAAVGQNKALFGGGQALYSTLAPQLISQAANPQGFGPQTLARLDTAAQESAGGGNAAAVGQGALEESRTRNAGGAGMALTKAARESGKRLSEATLQTRIANEGLKEQQREGAQKGLEGLYGAQISGAGEASGNVARNVEANAKQEDASWGWAKNILQPALAAAGGVGAAKFCWIAEALYGVDDPRTSLIRFWLSGPFTATPLGPFVIGLYRRFGQHIASSKWMVRLLKPLFDAALRRAEAWDRSMVNL